VSFCTFCCEAECDDGLCLCDDCEEIIREAIWERTRTDLPGLVEDVLWSLDSDDWSEPWLAEVRP